MNRILVTGAAGFVGSAVVNKLLSENCFVCALDIVDEPSNRLPLLNKNLVYKKIDVSDFDSIERICLENKIDTVYHFAWLGSAGPFREDYEIQVNNALNCVKLMEAVKRGGAIRFVVAGTIMEYESIMAVFFQNSKPDTFFIYGVGKQLAHSLCKLLSNKIGIELIWTNITNSYGVGELSPRLINSTIRKCINHEPLQFTSGTQNYDFIYIDDVALAFYLIGEKGKANKAYTIGSGKAGPLKHFLEELVYTCDKDAKPIFGDVPFTGTNLHINTFSIEELVNDCGFEPQVTFKEGVMKTYNWLKEIEKK